MLETEVQERIAALEGQVRRSRRVLGLAGILLAGLMLVVLEARLEIWDLSRYALKTTGVEIRDHSGGLRARLGGQPDGERPYFKFLDEQRHFRMFLALMEEGPVLTFSDSNGRVRMRLAVRDDGGVVEILDDEGNTSWSAP